MEGGAEVSDILAKMVVKGLISLRRAGTMPDYYNILSGEQIFGPCPLVLM